ncbi:MAG: HDIG domain-containing protein [Candidatus Bathyarchaeota archaeon]|nr:HDIG domain-containing protein [Candidatus Bathyarchaeota archaeon A05DMB-3]MDH7607030.1 HDIG domain-containing protein [Candidatus Bathyarchaeota archaeon]
MMSEEEAIQLIKSTSKYAHALLVSAIMAEMAKELKEDIWLWKIVGLLHDLDYDEVKGDMQKHGIVTAEKLKERLPEKAVYAIKAHDYRTGVKPKSKLDKALIATDSAVVIIEKIMKAKKELTVKTFQAEITKASKTTSWHKSNIARCVEFGLSLNKFLQLCINSAKESEV